MDSQLLAGIFVGLSLVVAIFLARSRSRRVQIWIAVAFIAIGLVYAAFMSGLLA